MELDRRLAAAGVRSDRFRQEILDGLVANQIVALVLRDGDACAICGSAIGDVIPVGAHAGRANWNATRPTVDHVLPKSHGGSGQVRNLRLAHAGCNSERGDVDCPRCNGDFRICIEAMRLGNARRHKDRISRLEARLSEPVRGRERRIARKRQKRLHAQLESAKIQIEALMGRQVVLNACASDGRPNIWATTSSPVAGP